MEYAESALESVGITMDLQFYQGKRVLVTGHSGFKGIWLCRMLIEAGAHVCGYSLPPKESKTLFCQSGISKKMDSHFGDIRDFKELKTIFDAFQPEIVFHLAAQPLVLDSYEDPRYTYETNVMGTVNICECIRLSKGVKSFLNVTTDKVYKNNEWEWGYREDEALDGFDPYSNSKSCSELVTHSYIRSFFQKQKIAVSTARAGNVIGGGDESANRIIPDCVRAALEHHDIFVRNPNSVRPYQHVLEPLAVYLMIARKQYENAQYGGFYNVGPDETDCICTGDLAELFCNAWGDHCKWKAGNTQGPHEANYLKLDCSRLKKVFGWKPRWGVSEAVYYTVEMYKALHRQEGNACMLKQIKAFYQE